MSCRDEERPQMARYNVEQVQPVNKTKPTVFGPKKKLVELRPFLIHDEFVTQQLLNPTTVVQPILGPQAQEHGPANPKAVDDKSEDQTKASAYLTANVGGMFC